MTAIIFAAILAIVIGLICAIVLVLADKFMSVPVDERFPKIRNCLPGANCGACGYTGCDGYAQALIDNPDVKTNLCVPGGDGTAKAIADVLGKEAEDVIEMVAVVKCDGNCSVVKQRFEYKGVKTCEAANMFYGGAGTCSFGCIGLGDCARACPQNAICIENGVAYVNSELCIGCGICAKKCPHNIIELMPDVNRTLVLCSSHDKGAVVRKFCTNGCIACGKCTKTCPNGAITLVNNLATIDYEKCTNCGACRDACPVHCIVEKDISGIHRVAK